MKIEVFKNSHAIRFDLRRLDWTDLNLLRRFSATKSQDNEPGFYSWLFHELSREAERRESAEEGDFSKESELLEFPSLTNHQLADALVGMTALSYSSGLSETLGQLIDHLVVEIIAITSNRLKRG